MSFLITLAKKALALTPYRIVRSAPNRFQEIDHCLAMLARLGYRPGVIVDGGAHLGAFALAAHAVWPGARLHMIEPQPACQEALKRLAAARGFALHPYALSDREGSVRFMCQDRPDTGAYIAWSHEQDKATVEVPTRRLDDLVADQVKPTDRALLKLDLQGHEIVAMRGAPRLLPLVEVVLTEVSFFRQVAEPSIAELVQFFDAQGFDLFDVAALSGRARDDRLRQGDFIFVRRGTALAADATWD